MGQTIINAIIPVAVAALIAVLGAVISAVGDAGVQFIKQKKVALAGRIGMDTYNAHLAFAKSAWAIVDEHFRITPTVTKTIESAQEKFTEEIKKLAPSITDIEIDQLRQTVAGEVNKGREAITTGLTEIE